MGTVNTAAAAVDTTTIGTLNSTIATLMADIASAALHPGGGLDHGRARPHGWHRQRIRLGYEDPGAYIRAVIGRDRSDTVLLLGIPPQTTLGRHRRRPDTFRRPIWDHVMPDCRAFL